MNQSILRINTGRKETFDMYKENILMLFPSGLYVLN